MYNIPNVPQNILKDIVYLFSLSLRESKILNAWKSANITMIPKKPSLLPTNQYDKLSRKTFRTYRLLKII
ncbi:hypothetical protein BpHYR1_016737 [Brachionus plicatilis]|uniref:RNA-directed DNA polymerase from mobile element jockey-like n=1 Tax=Brachionus plicatilis TaxID=10195 RepID=A0A3M7Q2K5_BRAPC|nr:hypothetical protein BpHYR1_016737 [Brachionus plicatilis]